MPRDTEAELPDREGPDSRVRLLHVEGLDDDTAALRSPSSKEIGPASPPSSQLDLSRERWADTNDQISACMKENVSIRGDIRSMRTTMQKNAQEIMSALESERHERLEKFELMERRLQDDRSGDSASTDTASASLISDLEQRLQELQRLLEQEMAARAAGDEQMARQISRVTPSQFDAGEKEAGTTASEIRQASEQALAEERASVQPQLKDLRLCLEAEVGARSAATERLAREVKEMRVAIDAPSNEKPGSSDKLKESLHSIGHALQSRMQLLEDKLQNLSLLHEDLASRQAWEEKVQMMLERQEQRKESHDLETEMLRDSLKGLEDQAKKHVMWVETQVDKHGTELKDISQKLSHESRARTTLDEELRQLLVTELQTQAKFFQTEIKTLLSMAHDTWQDEIKKIWIAFDPSGKKPDVARIDNTPTPKRDERHSEPGSLKTSTIAMDGRSSEPYVGKGSSLLVRRPYESEGERVGGKGTSENVTSKGGALLTSRHSESSPSNSLEGRSSDPPQVGKGSYSREGRPSDPPQVGKGSSSLEGRPSDPPQVGRGSSLSLSANDRVPRQASTPGAGIGVRSEPLPGRVSGAGLQRPQPEPKRQQFQGSESATNRNFTRIRLD